MVRSTGRLPVDSLLRPHVEGKDEHYQDGEEHPERPLVLIQPSDHLITGQRKDRATTMISKAAGMTTSLPLTLRSGIRPDGSASIEACHHGLVVLCAGSMS